MQVREKIESESTYYNEEGREGYNKKGRILGAIYNER